MIFYTQADSYEPYLPYYLSYYPPCYPPCYPQYGYSGGFGSYDQGDGYNYGYDSGSPSTPSIPPCSYGYRYTRRGSCYEPCAYRLGYGARRNFPSRRYYNPNPW